MHNGARHCLLFLLSMGITNTALSAVLQRAKVEGVWHDGRILVHKVKERDPNKDPRRLRIAGTITDLDRTARSLTIAGVTLSWPATFDARPELASGQAVEIDAYRTDPGFEIRAMKSVTLEPDAVEIIGVIERARRRESVNRLSISGIPVDVPLGLYSNGRVRLRRLDDRRPEDQLRVTLGGVDATLGGEVEFSSDVLLRHDLTGDADDEAQFETSVDLEAFFELTPSVSAYAELKLSYETEYDIPWVRDEDEFELERGELWLYTDRPFEWPFSLQLGRQNFAEEREWWWDTDLDAIRAIYNGRIVTAEFAVARELAKEVLNDAHADAEDTDINRVLGNVQWRYSSALILDLFFLHQRDVSSGFVPNELARVHEEDELDADLTWWGLRASGGHGFERGFDVNYWLDLAFVRGEETRYEFDDVDSRRVVVEERVDEDRSGWAFDAGASITLRGRREPTFTLGLARGSGDDDAEGTFRETGLNDNSGKYNGVSRFRYYGELSRPELSNLQIASLAYGWRLGNSTSVELLYHNYRQLTAQPEHSLRIDQDANSRNRHLGDEINLVFSAEEWKHWEMELIGNYFIPGSAFAQDKGAWRFSYKLNYNF